MERALPLVMQLLWTACGVMAAALIGSYAAWAYPQGRPAVWTVTWASMAVVAILSVGPVTRALREWREGGDHG